MAASRLYEEVLRDWQREAVDAWRQGDGTAPHRGTLEVFWMLATFRETKRNGGRLYVNEAGAMFGPVGDDLRDLRYYFGQIDLAEWFEDPLG